MDSKTAFNKDNGTKISFSELVELIGTTCDYKFCIIDETIDEELMTLAAKHGIDLTGFKHVIEISGIQHAENAMAQEVTTDNHYQKDVSHQNTILKYTKQIGDTYYYVEEIRKKNKSLAFKSLLKRETKNPSQ